MTIMAVLNQTSLIEARQAEIAREIARLQEEANELLIALKVIRRLEPDSPKTYKPAAEAQLEGAENPKLGPRRPSGCPSNFEMVDMILGGAEREGKDGLTISELIGEMRSRYWPGLNDIQVSAAIYAFVRKGRLRKTPSGKFKRIRRSSKENEAPT